MRSESEMFSDRHCGAASSLSSGSELEKRVDALKQKYLRRNQVWEPCAVMSSDASAVMSSDDTETVGVMSSDESEASQSGASSDGSRGRFALRRNCDSAEEEYSDEEDDGLMDVRGQRSNSTAVCVYQEMIKIYEQLQKERVSQQAWSVQLCERERDVQHLEMQQHHSVSRLQQLERDVFQRLQRLLQDRQQLQESLELKKKENKRMRSSYDSLKESNESLKKQLQEATDQNRQLECRWRRTRARLQNLPPPAQRRSQPVMSFQCPAQPKKADRPLQATGSSPAPSAQLLGLLCDWVVDVGLQGSDQASAAGSSLLERSSRVLLLLTERLQQTSAQEQPLPQLRCIYHCFLQLEHDTQHHLLSSTLRRLGEGVCRGLTSQCLHTRLLSSLIVLKSLSQVDVLAQALGVLCAAVGCDEGRSLFLEYKALQVVLVVLRVAGPGLLSPALNVLMQMSAESAVLPSFLSQCSTGEFFRCVSLLLKNPRLMPPQLEKVLMLLLKLSSVRTNKRLFEASSLHLLLQEMHTTSDPARHFLRVNLSAILLNLGLLTRP